MGAKPEEYRRTGKNTKETNNRQNLPLLRPHVCARWRPQQAAQLGSNGPVIEKDSIAIAGHNLSVDRPGTTKAKRKMSSTNFSLIKLEKDPTKS